MSAERNVIQIATLAEGEGRPNYLYAVCDDGTLWVMMVGHADRGWKKVEGIPQDDTKKSGSTWGRDEPPSFDPE